MKNISIKESKKIQIEILIHVDSLCKKNNIKYFIDYGTLLGAVRHEGFIPWDDDIDISMPRKDYNKFIKLFKQTNSKYKLLSLETDDKYYNNFIKIFDSSTKIIDNRNYKTYESGIFIDIFPMDTFNDKAVINKCYNLESFKLLSFSKRKNINYQDSKIKDLIRSTVWLLLKPISPRLFAKKIEISIKKYQDDDGQYIAFIPSKLKEKEIFKTNLFEELIELKFENLLLPAPKEYHKILTQYYGDYLKLPPKEQQVNIHEYSAYILEDR